MVKLIYHFGKDGTDEFIYEPSDDVIKQCSRMILKNIYSHECSETADDFFEFIETHIEEIKEYLYYFCEAMAHEEYLDYIDEKKNPYTYRGIKENDFH